MPPIGHKLAEMAVADAVQISDVQAQRSASKKIQSMPQNNPLLVEKQFRAFLGARSLKLASLTLPQAFDAMAAFWIEVRDFEVLAENGDGIACYQDVTDHGRGTRLEIGFVRILRVAPEDSGLAWPAHRLKLRVCFKWDRDVISKVLPAGSWSFACWNIGEFESFKRSLVDTAGFSVMREKTVAEANVLLDTIASQPRMLQPEADRQMWWGVM